MHPDARATDRAAGALSFSESAAVSSDLPPSPLARLPWRPFRSAPSLFGRRRNRVEAPGVAGALLKATTLFDHAATDNRVSAGKGFRSQGLFITIAGHRNHVRIGEGVTWSGRIILRGNDLKITIGDRSEGKGTLLVAWDQPIAIGADCLIAPEVEIRSADIHPIVDAATGTLLNAPAPVVIGDRVWIAKGALVLKGAAVAPDSVVGARAVVTAVHDRPGCILAGNPARVLREGVRWRR